MPTLKIPTITGLVLILILASMSAFGGEADHAEGFLEVTFLDVGQGDAIFIESPTGTQVLIDGGKSDLILSQLESVMGFGDKTLDMIVATHPDADHIGGLIPVLERYDVRTILMTENESDTPVSLTFRARVAEEGSHIIFARKGDTFDLGAGAHGSTTLMVLFPDRDPSRLESNTASIVTQLVYGDSEYLLTGDAPKEIEEHLVRVYGGVLHSDVLKAGHHGSRTSSAETFVTAVQPSYAIISAGKNNSYGHPHKEVLDIFRVHNIPYKNTADEGSITIYSDGIASWFK